MASKISTQVLIIGGGATGIALARDLSLRGVKSLLVEKKDINAGASGANHGLLHSGARYVYSDPEAAAECAEESAILKATAPHCIEETGGLFVAVEGDDEEYIRSFPQLCSNVNIEAEPISPQEALELEPSLSSKVIAAYRVNDASIDPFRLSLEMLQDACQLGCRYLSQHKVVDIDAEGERKQVVLEKRPSGERVVVEADLVVSAAGTWAAEIAAMAGVELDMIYSKGSLLITHHRVTSMVINRLRPPADADIIVPGGTVSVLGTTSVVAENPDNVFPTSIETETIIDECSQLIPSLKGTRMIRAYTGVRPLVGGPSEEDSRSITRGFALIDHQAHGLDNFLTITGGKLSTCRLMAEKTADLVCRKLGVSAVCKTKTVPIGAAAGNQWTEPGHGPSMWFRKSKEMGELLCECEMISSGSIRNIANLMNEQGLHPGLKSVGLRSRIGKGSCQGGFCSLRVTSHMYNEGYFSEGMGTSEIRAFINGRWRGLRPLVSGSMASQVELQEAIQCGVFGLDQPLNSLGQ